MTHGERNTGLQRGQWELQRRSGRHSHVHGGGIYKYQGMRSTKWEKTVVEPQEEKEADRIQKEELEYCSSDAGSLPEDINN